MAMASISLEVALSSFGVSASAPELVRPVSIDDRPTGVELTAEEVSVLEGLALEITANPSEDAEEYCEQVKSKASRIPVRVKSALEIFYSRGCANGFFLVQGLRVDDDSLGETPQGNIYKRGEATLLARIQAILVSSCGAEMIAYQAEGYGRLYQDVVPIKSMAMLQTSVGSGVELVCLFKILL